MARLALPLADPHLALRPPNPRSDSACLLLLTSSCPAPQRSATCFWENVGQMVTEQRKRAAPEVVEQFRLSALRALEDLGSQLEPLWQQLRWAPGRGGRGV